MESGLRAGGRVTPTTARGDPMAVREAEPVGSLQEVHDVGLDREDLFGIYRNMLTARGIEERGHILYKQGKIPGSFYTGRGNEASAVGVATRDGARRRRLPAPTRHGRAHHARRRAVADLRAVHGSRRRARPRPRRERPPRRRPARAARDGQPSAGDAPRRRRDGARVPDPGGAPRRDRLVRRRCRGPRRRARGHELRRGPAPAGRVRDRQQPVGVLDARSPRATPSSISPTGQRATASTGSSSTAPTCSPSTARRSARSRRPARVAARP